MKPILVTVISESTIEVLTDYQTTLLSAGTLSISRGSQRAGMEEGLIGAIWTLDGDIPNGTLTLTVRHYRGEGGEHEYIFKV